mmetsp:Transcript_17374/g.37487  ORF Transcript_17374/g.37487 Transcript_17374/m.37487 type:complete len:253 (+) Transcript_17374:399-1157(+)
MSLPLPPLPLPIVHIPRGITGYAEAIALVFLPFPFVGVPVVAEEDPEAVTLAVRVEVPLVGPHEDAIAAYLDLLGDGVVSAAIARPRGLGAASERGRVRGQIREFGDGHAALLEVDTGELIDVEAALCPRGTPGIFLFLLILIGRGFCLYYLLHILGNILLDLSGADVVIDVLVDNVLHRFLIPLCRSCFFGLRIPLAVLRGRRRGHCSHRCRNLDYLSAVTTAHLLRLFLRSLLVQLIAELLGRLEKAASP